MSQVDLPKLLNVIDDYVMIKKSFEFPKYTPGSDLDLLIIDKEYAIKKIVQHYETDYQNKFDLMIVDNGKHCHVDFLLNGAIDIRIDIIQNFDFYNRFTVKNSFLFKMLKDKQTICYGDYSIFVPSKEDDLIIRYFEYLEYFDRYPNKVKHIDYICNVKDQSLKNRFIENTHRYIRFSRSEWKEKINILQKPISVNMAINNIYINIKYILKTLIHTVSWSVMHPKRVINKLFLIFKVRG